MRALAITGIETAALIFSIMSGSDIRATPPCARISAGTRSSAITATAPAASAILACSALTTSMMTPPLSISAMPRLTRAVPTFWLMQMLLVMFSWQVFSSRSGCLLYFESGEVGAVRVNSGLRSVKATQTEPAANLISLPSAKVQVVPDSAVGLFQLALKDLPSRKM